MLIPPNYTSLITSRSSPTSWLCIGVQSMVYFIAESVKRERMWITERSESVRVYHFEVPVVYIKQVRAVVFDLKSGALRHRYQNGRCVYGCAAR